MKLLFDNGNLARLLSAILLIIGFIYACHTGAEEILNHENLNQIIEFYIGILTLNAMALFNWKTIKDTQWFEFLNKPKD